MLTKKQVTSYKKLISAGHAAGEHGNFSSDIAGYLQNLLNKEDINPDSFNDEMGDDYDTVCEYYDVDADESELTDRQADASGRTLAQEALDLVDEAYDKRNEAFRTNGIEESAMKYLDVDKCADLLANAIKKRLAWLKRRKLI